MNKTGYIISNYCIIRNQKILCGQSAYSEPNDAGYKFLISAYQHFGINYPKFYKMDNLSKLGFLATELLLTKPPLQKQYKPDEMGIILSNASSSLSTDILHQQSIASRSDYFPSPSVFVYTLPNVMIGEICIRHKFSGEGCFFIHEKFNADFLYQYAIQLLNSEIIQVCITGWVEMNEQNYESVVYLIEKSSHTNNQIANFDPDALNRIFLKDI